MMKTTVSQQWHGNEVKIQGRKVVNKSAYEIGLVVEGQAKELCPVDTGRLAGSITTQSATEGTNPRGPGAVASDVIQKPTTAGEVLVGTPVEYGPHMEFGTIKTDAQPFLRPALDIARGKTMPIVERNAKFHFGKYLLEHDAYLKSRGIT